MSDSAEHLAKIDRWRAILI